MSGSLWDFEKFPATKTEPCLSLGVDTLDSPGTVAVRRIQYAETVVVKLQGS